MNVVVIEVMEFNRIAIGEVWWGFAAYDSYAEAFSYETQSENEFRKTFPDTQSIVRRVSELGQFEDINFSNLKESELHVVTPDWMEVNHHVANEET